MLGAREADAFALDITKDESFPVCADEIEHATRILEAIIQSSQNGKIVDLR